MKIMRDRIDPRDATDTYQPNDFIALALAALASERLDDEHIKRFAADIRRLRERSDNRYLETWEHLIASGREALRSTFLDRSDRGQVLRSVCTFRAFVSPRERAEIISTYVPQRTAERSRPD